MRQHFPTLLLLSLLLMAGCNDTPFVDEISTGTPQTFTLSVSMPDNGDPSTKVTAAQKPGSMDIALKWKECDKIQLYFKSENTIIQGDEVRVQNISEDGKTADFIVDVPQGVTGAFDLYGVHGTTSETDGSAILLNVTPGHFVKLEDAKVPLYFKKENVTAGSVDQNVNFQHLGALQVVTLKNTINQKITLGSPALVLSEDSGDKWYYDAVNNEYPLYDLDSGAISMVENKSPLSGTYTPMEVGYEDNIKLAQWIMPNGQKPPSIHFKATIGGMERITEAKGARTSRLEAGHAYHLYALWNGSEAVNPLSFATEAAVQAIKITMTTGREIDKKINLWFDAEPEDKTGVWIDLNNNGVKDANEEVKKFWEEEPYTITIGSQTITIYGKVTKLDCSSNSLTALDVSGASALTHLDCLANSLTELDVSQNTALTHLACFLNSLTELDISNNTALCYLDCSRNSLNALDVSYNTALTELNCYDNELTTLDVSGLTALNYLFCYNNFLTALDVSGATALTYLYCYNNSLTALDVSGATALIDLFCNNNKIQGDEMTNLVKSLPLRSEDDEGQFNVINTNGDENVCTQAQKDIATGKYWYVCNSNGERYYPGS